MFHWICSLYLAASFDQSVNNGTVHESLIRDEESWFGTSDNSKFWHDDFAGGNFLSKCTDFPMETPRLTSVGS